MLSVCKENTAAVVHANSSLSRVMSDQKSIFFVHPPVIQPRRQEAYEMSTCNAEGPKHIKFPGLLMVMEAGSSARLV